MADIKTIEERIQAKAESEQTDAERTARGAIMEIVRGVRALRQYTYGDDKDTLLTVSHLVFGLPVPDEMAQARSVKLREGAVNRRCDDHRTALLDCVGRIEDFVGENS